MPDPPIQWGEYSLGGWHADTLERDGVPHVFTREPHAWLRLPVQSKSERVLELHLWSPPEALGEEHGEAIEVLLNGVSLAVLERSAEAVRHTFPGPSRCGSRATNALALVVKGRAERPGGSDVALAEVRYGTERVARIEASTAPSCFWRRGIRAHGPRTPAFFSSVGRARSVLPRSGRNGVALRDARAFRTRERVM